MSTVIYKNPKRVIYKQEMRQTNYLISCTTRRNSSAVGFRHVRSSKDVEPRLFRIAALVVLPKLIN